VALAWLLTHIALHSQRLTELRVVLVCGAVGLLVDATLTASGWLILTHSQWGLPFWLYVLWGCFAATLNNAMHFFQNRLRLAALLGAVFGPLSYYAGTAFDRLAFPSAWSSLMVLAGVWAVLLPALLYLARRLSSLSVIRATA
jgi:hypothetical protein